MARRRRNDVSGWDLFVTLVFFGVIAYFIIKWALIIIGVVIACIVSIITWIVNIIKKKNNAKNITKTPFENTKLNDNDSLLPPIQIEKQKLGVFDKNIYDDFFPIQIRSRGELYYYDNRIKEYKENENNYSCVVSGTTDYNVSISLDEENMLIDSSCDCPYFADKKKNCKHIYALLYKVKCSENKDKILSEIESQISGIKTMLKNAGDYLKRNKSHFTTSVINEFNMYSEQYKNRLVIVENSVFETKLEDSLLNKLDTLLDIKSELKQRIKKTLNEENASNNTTSYVQSNNNSSNENKIGLSDVIAGIGISSMIDDHINNQKDRDYDEKLEKEMDNYALEEWQKDLVRKGEYDPWNFEEDGDLTEDDYYYEDN